MSQDFLSEGENPHGGGGIGFDIVDLYTAESNLLIIMINALTI